MANETFTDFLFTPERMDGETFEAYKNRRRLANRLGKAYLKRNVRQHAKIVKEIKDLEDGKM